MPSPDNAPLEIVCAHSPDSDDAFMFYALATRKIRSDLVVVKHLLSDIETLNQQALKGAYELTAISYHAYPYVADKYFLMAAGSSIGDDYGPMLVSRHPIAPGDLKGKRIAVPGKLTTAYLACPSLSEPDVAPEGGEALYVLVHTPFLRKHHDWAKMLPA